MADPSTPEGWAPKQSLALLLKSPFEQGRGVRFSPGVVGKEISDSGKIEFPHSEANSIFLWRA